MRTTDIPHTPDTLKQFTLLVKTHDILTERLQALGAETPIPTTRTFVGGCTISSEEGVKLVVPIYLDDALFMVENPQDYQTLPLAILAILTNNERIIIINNQTRVWMTDDVRNNTAVGVIAHEMGHLLSGQPDRQKQESNANNEPIDYEGITVRLLNGELRGDPDELEANSYAIGLVGTAPILSMIAVHSSLSKNIGVRMEFSNQLHYWIDMLAAEFKPHTYGREDFRVSVYTDEELAELKLDDVSQDPC